MSDFFGQIMKNRSDFFRWSFGENLRKRQIKSVVSVKLELRLRTLAHYYSQPIAPLSLFM